MILLFSLRKERMQLNPIDIDKIYCLKRLVWIYKNGMNEFDIVFLQIF